MVSDSLASARKANLELLKSIRKKNTDSLAAVRKVRTDSLTAIRKKKADELAKKKDNQMRDRKIAEKTKENKNAIALELKIKKKRSALQNKSMLKKKWRPTQSGAKYVHALQLLLQCEAKNGGGGGQYAANRKRQMGRTNTILPFNPLSDSAMSSADMDSVIQKASLGIQIHDYPAQNGPTTFICSLGKPTTTMEIRTMPKHPSDISSPCGKRKRPMKQSGNRINRRRAHGIAKHRNAGK